MMNAYAAQNAYATAPMYYVAAPVGYGAAPVKDEAQKPRFQMTLHNWQMQGRVLYTEAWVSDGPRHAENWTATVCIISPVDRKSVMQTFTGSGRTKQAAREDACAQALYFLGWYPGC